MKWVNRIGVLGVVLLCSWNSKTIVRNKDKQIFNFTCGHI